MQQESKRRKTKGDKKASAVEKVPIEISILQKHYTDWDQDEMTTFLTKKLDAARAKSDDHMYKRAKVVISDYCFEVKMRKKLELQLAILQDIYRKELKTHKEPKVDLAQQKLDAIDLDFIKHFYD